MQTTRPISSISFNTDRFIITVLFDLVDNHIISFFALIKHYGEPKESKDTLKDHLHLYIEPNKRIDTMSLAEKFKEIDLKNPKPLGTLPFNYSKFDDWFLYGIHDPMYLASKGMTRQYFYLKEDIITNNMDYLDNKINEIDPRKMNYYFDMRQCQLEGYSFNQYMIKRNIHPMQIKAYYEAWIMTEMISTTSKARTKKASEEDINLNHLPIKISKTSLPDNIIVFNEPKNK